jgi:hypothetical protein
MVIVVEIIPGRLMRDGLARQGCQLAIKMSRRNKGLPNGPIGSHLEVPETRLA